LGHCNEVKDLILFDDLSREEKIQQIRAKGKKTYVILSDGKVFSWPFTSKDGEIYA
jgi:hypothetical protein